MNDKVTRSHSSRNLRIGIGLFMLAWALALGISYCMVSAGHGYWLELLNGATWPQQFVANEASNGIEPIRSCWFYLILSFRTVLNLGIILTAAFILYFLLTGQAKEWLMNNLESVLSTRDTAMAAFIDDGLRKRELPLTDPQREALFEVANSFLKSRAGRAFLKASLNAAERQE